MIETTGFDRLAVKRGAYGLGSHSLLERFNRCTLSFTVTIRPAATGFTTKH